jgi:hypothetical protein
MAHRFVQSVDVFCAIKRIIPTLEPPPKVGCEVVLNERNYVIQFEFNPTLTDTTLYLRPLSATDKEALTRGDWVKRLETVCP